MREPARLPLFVYGTLRDPKIRERLLGAVPMRTEPARAAGSLVTSGLPWPTAAFRAEGELHGELLWLPDAHYERCLVVLDAYEGAPELYRRVQVTAHAASGVLSAWAYEWQRPTSGQGS